MNQPKFKVSDLVQRVEDGAWGTISDVSNEFCSYCLSNSGPYQYAISPLDGKGKHAWFETKDLILIRRHEELK